MDPEKDFHEYCDRSEPDKMNHNKRKQVCIFLFFLLFFGSGFVGCSSRNEAVFFEEGDVPVEETEEKPQEAGMEDAPEASENEGKGMADLETDGEDEEPDQMPRDIYVDVCGAVVHPGVYTLSPESRVFEAVAAAGGYLPEAAGYCINQAQMLRDGQQIYVPTVEEAQETGQTAPADTARMEESGNAADQTQERVNLNTADETILGSLTGIGPSKAKAILTYREENGAFSSVEEIMNVPGIKEGTYEKIKDEIAVE